MEDKNALILSVGGSKEPLIFCLKKFDYDLVCFIHSEDTKNDSIEIIKELEIPEDKYQLKQVDDHQSLENAFSISREVINSLKNDYSNIHVDFTGGTKTMSSGLVLAAIGADCNYTYVGTEEERTKNNKGTVQSGFEKLTEQKDPYDLYAVIEFDRGKDSFNNYQFSASKVNFREALKKLESKELKELCRLYIKTVILYDKWDKFDHLIGDGVELNKYLKDEILIPLKKIESVNEDYPKFIPQIKENVEFLNLKLFEEDKIQTNNVKYYLVDLLNNAKRRIEEEKYDDAVARLYRAIELIAQLQLTNIGVIDDDYLSEYKKFYINKDKVLDHEDKELVLPVKNHPKFERPGRRFGIALTQSYDLLDAMGIKVAKKYKNDDNIQYNVSLRNTSILAHGLNNIDKSKANEFYRQVFKYAKIVFPEVGKYMKMAKFPKFQ